MNEVRALNRDAAKQQPERVFENPLEIVSEILLTKGEKLATLNRWRRSILGELDASDEGMAAPFSDKSWCQWRATVRTI